MLRQSVRDADGRIHSDGWGLAHYTSVGPHLVRNAEAAVDGEDLRWAAAEAYSTNVLAHVRSATVGARLGVNTHLFYLILSSLQRAPAAQPAYAVRECVRTVERWAKEADPNAAFAVNLVLTNGPLSVVLRYGRSFWFAQRSKVHACQVCAGTIHVDGLPPTEYRAVAFASEQITTDENWIPVEEGRLFTISPSLEVAREDL